MDPSCQEARSELCARCAVALCERGVKGVVDADSLLAWMEQDDPRKAIRILLEAGFRFCLFDNRVDELFVQLVGRFGIVIDTSLMIARDIPPHIATGILERLSREADEAAK